MKKYWILLLAAAACACVPNTPSKNGTTRNLTDGWQLSRTNGAEKVAAQVPSTVAGALYASGFWGNDLLQGRNYANADKTLFDDEWVYQTTFPARLGDGQHATLVFDGLNFYADVFLNGTQIASADTTYGVFRRWEFNVDTLLQGKNQLEVRLRRAQPGDLNIGFVDWNPRPLDESMGIVRPVSLHTTGAVSIEDLFVIPDLDVTTLAQADLEVRVKLRNHEDHPVEADLELAIPGAGEGKIHASLAAGETTVLSLTPEQAACLHLDHPRIWWSHDLGTPELYELMARVDTEGVLSDTRTVTFGVRKIESRLIEKNYRQFSLNGKDILLKGAGWTDDIFLGDTPETIERQVRYVKDMNMNLIRFENIWGKDDTVYDLCDREGVLALVGWSCQWEWKDYCGLPEVDGFGCINDPRSENLAVAYFQDQVVRLHNHPAIIAWMTGSDCIPNPSLEERYMEIYRQEDYRPYVNSAKEKFSTVSGWSGTKMAGPYEYVGPDYWFVDTQNGGAFGFNTETGIGANLPQLESLRKMIPADALWPLSPYWDYHCTTSGSAMNNMEVLSQCVRELYGEPESLEEFVRKGHAVDYDGTRAMFESFRVRLPQTTGIVQWMLNSAWPSIYWQLYDWYGVPTAGYYGTKKACEPEQLIFDYRDRKVYAVSERPEGRTLTATMKVFNDASQLIGEDSQPVQTAYRSVTEVFDLHIFDGQPHFVALSLIDADGNTVADNFYCLGARDNEYDFPKSTWYMSPIRTWTDLKFAFQQEPADVDMTVVPTEDGYTVTLENHSSAIAYMNILKALDKNGELAVPAYWSDNFFPLLPGESKTVTCDTDGKDVRIQLND